MRKLLLLSAILIFGLASCSNPPGASSPTEDVGVMIGGIRWATRNVDAPGTFAARPEDPGMLYQWNRRVGWSSADPIIGSDGSTWSSGRPGGTEWTRDNDPCPPGWRVPTVEELTALHNAGSEWRMQNEVRGRFFGTAPNRIFLPAVGLRNHNGALNLVGAIGYYWSSSEAGEGLAFFLRNVSTFTGIADYNRARGFSVRCVAE